MFSSEQRAAVVNAFEQAGYRSPLMIAPVTSGDERIFVLSAGDFGALSDRRALEQTLQELLRCKVWIVERSPSWAVTEPFC